MQEGKQETTKVVSLIRNDRKSTKCIQSLKIKETIKFVADNILD